MVFLDLFRINKKKYCFDHGIVTDGVSVSCQFVYLKKSQKKEKKEEISVDSLLGRTIVEVDPGKHSIIYMTSDYEKKKNISTIQIFNVV